MNSKVIYLPMGASPDDALNETRREADALRAELNDLRVRYAHYKFDTWQLRQDNKALRMERDVLRAELSFAHEAMRSKYASHVHVAPAFCIG